jgi:hypothetical protein
LDVSAAAKILDRMLKEKSARPSIRERLQVFAEETGVPV